MSGRPKMGVSARVKVDTTVSAETMKTIESLKRPGESRGQVIDRAVEALKKEEK